jgi:hypothetical protein
VVQVRAGSGSRPNCCGCASGCVGHDRLPGRRFVSFPPLSAMQGMRRGDGAVIVSRRQTHAHKRLHAVWRTQPSRFDDLLRHYAAFRYEHAAASRARRSGQFAMKAPISHKGTGWTIARNFPIVPAGTRT